ncbi:hypothetical protein AB5I41_02815 [Sphingomonas sp. MMS24-JH45]
MYRAGRGSGRPRGRCSPRCSTRPAGGCRIQTIHGFCQSLLAGFPIEAGLVPASADRAARGGAAAAAGARRPAGRCRARGAQRGRRHDRRAQRAAGRTGRGRFSRRLLPRAGGAGGTAERDRAVRARAVEVPLGDMEVVAAGCAALDISAVERIVAANRAWGTATGSGHADIAAAWLAADAAGRVASLEALMGVVFTGKGEPRKASAKLIAADPLCRTRRGARHRMRRAARAAHPAPPVCRPARRGAGGRAGVCARLCGGEATVGCGQFDDLIRAAVDLLRSPASASGSAISSIR